MSDATSVISAPGRRWLIPGGLIPGAVAGGAVIGGALLRPGPLRPTGTQSQTDDRVTTTAHAGAAPAFPGDNLTKGEPG